MRKSSVSLFATGAFLLRNTVLSKKMRMIIFLLTIIQMITITIAINKAFKTENIDDEEEEGE
jgi:hypothetical protein